MPSIRLPGLDVTSIATSETQSSYLPGQRTAFHPALVMIGCMALGAAYAGFAGEDVNWDWQNYHHYNVWALLNGRYDHDVVPPGFQTYFNSYIYFPWYYLRETLPPVAAGMIMGAVHGLNLALIYWLARLLLGSAANVLTIGAILLLAACGPMTLSETGTSFADILTAIPIIGGLLLILARDDVTPRYYIIAGLLVGLALGLKLTNIVFAIGLGAAALAAARPTLAMLYLAIGGVIGSLIGGGTWGLMLWREFGNPFFPLLNSVFPSPELPALTILDRQFIPRDFLDGLAYPFYWLMGDYRSSEFPFRDARFAILMLLIPVAIAARIKAGRSLFSRREWQLMLFFVVSYAVWLALFAIHRYIVALELLTAPLIVLMLVRCIDAVGQSPSGRSTGLASVAVAVAAALWLQPADWWRRPWSMPYRPAIPAELSQSATYLLLDKPLAFMAPFLPTGSRLYQVADIALPILPGGKFDRRIRDAMKQPLPGGVWEMHIKGRPPRNDALATYGLMVDASRSCVEIEGPQLATVNVACPLISTAR
jgi:hypothetical protein